MTTGATALFEATARPALEALRGGATGNGGEIVPARVNAAWQGVLAVLRVLAPSAPPDDARALVAALRQQGLCTLEEAHALVDLEAMTARLAAEPAVMHPASAHAEQVVARATQALARIVRTGDARETAAPLEAEYARAASRPPVEDRVAGARAAEASAPAPSTTGGVPAGPSGEPPPGAAGRRSSTFVVGLVVVCLVAAGIAALLFSGVGRRDAVAEGVAAYEAGQRMAARLAFERAAAADPSDARPFIYLGRLAREDGDVAQARRLLEQAVRREPDHPLAHRELASALLADGQTELARRFYVRALTLDPADRLAQGFLACALARLGRVDEAERWLERAGPGDWSACAAELPPPRGRP